LVPFINGYFNVRKCIGDSLKIYNNVQAMRGVAAIVILIQHSLTMKSGMGADELARLFEYFAGSGVDTFFVISGFIISQIAVNAPIKKQQLVTAADFAFRRVTRIYPLYWIVLALSVVVSFWVPLSGPSMPSAMSLISLTTTGNWFVPPAWTLAFEVYFYAGITAILMIAPRRLFLVILVWMIIQAMAGDLLPSWIHNHALVIEFGFGCLVAYLVDRGTRRLPATSVLVACMLLLLGSILSAQSGSIGGWARASTFGVGGALLIYAVVVAEFRGIKFPRIMQYLGDASYSIYIWHWLLLTVLAGMSEATGLIRLTPVSLRPVLLLSWIGVILVFALASYKYLERPILRILRRLGSHSKRLTSLASNLLIKRVDGAGTPSFAGDDSTSVTCEPAGNDKLRTMFSNMAAALLLQRDWDRTDPGRRSP
jgi:peptidoglycan/LPS O-acetylase OafA/YrhL